MRARRQKGAVFVLVLAILAGLTAIVASVAISQRFLIKAEAHALAQQRAKIIARAGVERAIETLCDEGSSGTTTTNVGTAGGSTSNTKNATTLQDDWATLGTVGGDRFMMNGGSFRLQILDASSKVNLNSATQQQLQNLPLSTEQIDSILDWRTAGENGRPDGAKDSYYNGLANPYDAALTGFSSVSELLDVRYFTPADLFDNPTVQSSTNTLPNFPDGRTPTLAELLTADSTSAMVDQQGNALRNLNTINAQNVGRIAGLNFPNSAARTAFLNAVRSSTSWATFLRNERTLSLPALRTLLNGYYIGSQTPAGRINPNTAPAAVLQTIPNLTADEAQSIVNQQSTGITSMGGLLTIPGMTTVASAANFLDYFAIKSQTFIVRVIGTVGSTDVPLEAVVSITPPAAGATSATARIIRMEEQPFHDMTGRWGWPTATTNDVVLEASS